MAKKSTANDGSTRAQKEQAVYFLSLSLENVRCFAEKQTLDLSDGTGRPARWTILLGNNGTGKTTLLQALVLFEQLQVSPEQGHPARAFKWQSVIPGRGIRFPRRTDSPAHLVATLAAGSALALGSTGFRRGEVGLEMAETELSSKLRFSSTPRNYPNPPVCYGYGAARRLGASSLGSRPGPDDATASLFSEQAELRNAEEWLLRLDYAATKHSEGQRRHNERLEQGKGLLLNLLPEVDDLRVTMPTTIHPTPRVEFKTPYGWVPLRQLGYGYQTLIGWMVDFASRMVERYPDSTDPLAEPAVVLVDEIDLHLHPAWQRKLIGYLTERFPNTQFIATAHSPLIVQAAGDANLAVLRREGDHVVIDNDVAAIRGWRIDQVLTSDLFGLKSARPPELDGLLDRRKALLTKSRLTDADEQELARLAAEIGDLPAGDTPEQAKTMSLLKETIEVLKQQKQ